MPWDESTNQENSKRLLRGHQMIERGVEPKQVAFNQFLVPSQRIENTYRLLSGPITISYLM